MTAEPTSHGWVLERLPAHAAGLLDDEDAARVAAHLERCEVCRAEADDPPLAAADPESARHVPASVLAVWKTASLDRLEREMVEAHLARCAECRRDLELAALAAETAAVHAGNGLAPVTRIDPPDPRPRAAAPRPGGGRRWVPWAVGGWAVAASLVAVTLAMRPPNTEAPGAMSPLGGSSPAIERAPATALPEVFSRVGQVVRLKSPERGAEGDDVQVIRVGDELALRFVIEPLIDVAPDAMIQIRLLGADGTSHAEIRVPHREAVHPDRGVLFHVGPELLDTAEPLMLTASAPRSADAPVAGEETSSYRIRLLRSR